MVDREAGRPGVRPEVVEADGLGVRDQRAEHTATAGEMADGIRGLGREPDVDELIEGGTVGGDDPERPVLGIHQFDGGFDDATQDHGQLDLADHRLHRAEEPPQAILRGRRWLRGDDDGILARHPAPLSPLQSTTGAGVSPDQGTFDPSITVGARWTVRGRSS